MTKNNELQTPQQQSTATVQSGLHGYLIQPTPEHKRLEVFVGRWINEGQTVASSDAPPVEILTSDVYEWMPGGFFILHTAYGLIGGMGVGGTEILGYDAASKTYRPYFFDSQGNISSQELLNHGDTWIWQGEKTRATAVFREEGNTQTVRHERLDDAGNWLVSMNVTLRKIQ